ncbi:penicillin-binding protein activator [Ursidibacter maritimus]|uniref:Penicillin-binding protein activator LpoA n=1 Tax=Ursidibacter maritimus TaxID=1331689 RepID=A0A949T3N4_9PAST|nr:penicillin-binding protein activator [Ursidibacter maritimus]KAE9540580.1 penicillin-binding protein [Ursidibacter maritimus]MBV6524413.1 penicillin-binding protein activator [Ursidibacter maritimus]MBV6526588.1 penicillin-binding protein activator [Ursidibacter maritimus]MBV6528531.1 penicillin-binding protein activator [Ursidibacter maritimus]MBV6530014.1 penicillin-binding protein activator [Ursidibacter maritimus]
MSTILVQTRTFSQKMKMVFVPTALALFLSACTGSSLFKNEVTESLKNEAYATSEFYINKAEQSSKETQQSYRLLAIRKLIDENKVVEAQNTMAQINQPELNDIQRVEFNLLNAQLAALQKNSQQATLLLNQLPKAQLSSSQLLRVYRTQAQIAESNKDVIEIVRARSLLDSYLGDNRARQENNDKIWETLRNANRGMLEKATAGVGEAAVAGWLALAVAYNQNIANPTQLPQAIESWKQQYPNHSAAQLLPTELQNVTSFQQTQLSGVALLLPLSGDAKILGDIIKRGFDDAKGQDATAIQVYDTNGTTISDILAQAKQQGTQTIIGPLLKARVDEMLVSPEISDLNVLALNATPNSRALGKVCYYGLSPEAEARSAADRFHQDRIENAVVVAPQDDFGQRSADAFAQRWRQLTNKDADIRYYHQPLDSISAIQTVGAAPNSGLYLLGNAEQLTELKQGLDSSSLAGKFALYSSSRSNSPNNGPDFRLTMEGVKFSEIPLLADTDSESYKKAETLAESDFSMMRLYAMGSDSWSIANKFNEFRQIPGYKVSGLTGVLSAGTNCLIEREMTWLKYQNGSVVSAQ